MIPIEPIDLTNAAPFDPISYYLHITIGLVGLFAALVALGTKKGSQPHIYAGRIFAICVVIVSITSAVLLSVRMVAPLLLAAMTAVYAIGTAVLALRPGTQTVRSLEFSLSIAQIVVVAMFLFLAIPQVMQSNIPPIGPLVLLAIPIILLVGDLNFYRKPDQRDRLRVLRHMSRMIWAFVVVVRAPIVEVNVVLQIPAPIILFAPLIIAPLLIFLFRSRIGGAAKVGS